VYQNAKLNQIVTFRIPSLLAKPRLGFFIPAE
jgi:hypothetical protein